MGPDPYGHHLVWPTRPSAAIRSILIAGCGTSQAVRHALRHPHADVVGIDVSATSIEHTERLAEQHAIRNLSVRRLAIEEVGDLGRRFDHIVCTGVLHHLSDPEAGLLALRSALAERGAITLMVYGRYGRTGVYIVQEYCRLLGLTTDPADVDDLIATLRELPEGHPLSRLLRGTRDFLHDDALADALLNPRDRAYSVPELLDLIDAAGLRFGRWAQQAPYSPRCGSIVETPHGARIAQLAPDDQSAAMELFRGTIDRHTAIVFAPGDAEHEHLDFSRSASFVPILAPSAVAVDEPARLPPGAAAALLNRSHPAPDLVLFVDARELAIFRSIDGTRTLAELGDDAPRFVERLWQHDLVSIDATGGDPG